MGAVLALPAPRPVTISLTSRVWFRSGAANTTGIAIARRFDTSKGLDVYDVRTEHGAIIEVPANRIYRATGPTGRVTP